jgi:hypothetical protein
MRSCTRARAQCPKTWLNALFSGILCNEVVCSVCGHVSATHDPCMDLSLELSRGRAGVGGVGSSSSFAPPSSSSFASYGSGGRGSVLGGAGAAAAGAAMARAGGGGLGGSSGGGGGGTDSLEGCLAQFTAAERLDGDNKYRCVG